jgi:hypothetical protein
MYILFAILECKNAFLISYCFILKSRKTAIIKQIFIDSSLVVIVNILI